MRERVCRGIHVRAIGTGLEQGVHQSVLEPPVQLREIRFCQASRQHRKTSGVMNKQHTVAALDGEQVGVPAAQRALGLVVGCLRAQQLSLKPTVRIQRQLRQQLSCAVKADHWFRDLKSAYILTSVGKSLIVQ